MLLRQYGWSRALRPVPGLELFVDVAELLSDGQLDMIEAGHWLRRAARSTSNSAFEIAASSSKTGPLELIVSPDECREEEFDRALVRIIGVQVVDGVPMVLLEADRTIGDNSRADDWDERCIHPPSFARSWSG